MERQFHCAAEVIVAPETDVPPRMNRVDVASALEWFVRLNLDESPTAQGLREAAAGLRGAGTLGALFPTILTEAMSVLAADFGNVQIADPETGTLRIVAHSGFDAEFLEYFASVDDDHAACGRAARRGGQMAIPDVATDLGFAPHREIAASAGFRAVASTPLIDHTGRLVGMVSTHFKRPGLPPASDLEFLELYGHLAGEALARRLPEADGAPVKTAGISDILHSQTVRDGDSLRLAEGVAEPLELVDTVIRRLFAAGLHLAGAQSLLGSDAASERVRTALAELDLAIEDTRAASLAMLLGPDDTAGH